MKNIFLIGHTSPWLKLPLGYEGIRFAGLSEVLV